MVGPARCPALRIAARRAFDLLDTTPMFNWRPNMCNAEVTLDGLPLILLKAFTAANAGAEKDGSVSTIFTSSSHISLNLAAAVRCDTEKKDCDSITNTTILVTFGLLLPSN